MDCQEEVKFLLRYYEKMNNDKSKMIDKVKEFMANKSFSKKSLNVIIITCELRPIYNLLDFQLISRLKEEQTNSSKVFDTLSDNVLIGGGPFKAPITSTKQKPLINVDPCSHSARYSGMSRGGC